MKRDECLQAAIELITKERADMYGDNSTNQKKIAKLWSSYLGLDDSVEITDIDVCVMMALVKISRISANKFHGDNYVDIAGYIGLAAELAEEEWNKAELP